MTYGTIVMDYPHFGRRPPVDEELLVLGAEAHVRFRVLQVLLEVLSALGVPWEALEMCRCLLQGRQVPSRQLVETGLDGLDQGGVVRPELVLSTLRRRQFLVRDLAARGTTPGALGCRRRLQSRICRLLGRSCATAASQGGSLRRRRRSRAQLDPESDFRTVFRLGGVRRRRRGFCPS